MKTRITKTNIIYFCISLVLFLLLCLGVSCIKKEDSITYPIVCLGDSILGATRDETAVTYLLQEKIGIEVFNGALGGTTLSRQDQKRRLGYNKDGLSLVGIAQAIAYQDFGVQRTINVHEPGTDYFKETVDELAMIDFSQVEILFIDHGINDYNASLPIYNEEDKYDEYSYTGALRSSIKMLQYKYPDLRIILITPTYSWFLSLEQTCEERYANYGYLEDYVNAELLVAEELGVEIIDHYHDFYPHENWEDWSIYTADGLHPNEAGRRKIAESMANYLNQ